MDARSETVLGETDEDEEEALSRQAAAQSKQLWRIAGIAVSKK